MLTIPLIFFDSEFSSLNPHEGEILSMGMVKENGNEFYIELESTATPSAWVKEHILPTLTAPKFSREEALPRIAEFIGPDQPLMVTFVSQYDTIYFYKLFNGPETPFFWLPIDFASILFAHGYNLDDMDQVYRHLHIDTTKYTQHHALDDARLLRDAYVKLRAESPAEE